MPVRSTNSSFTVEMPCEDLDVCGRPIYTTKSKRLRIDMRPLRRLQGKTGDLIKIIQVVNFSLLPINSNSLRLNCTLCAIP